MNSHHAICINRFVPPLIRLFMLSLASCGPTATLTPLPPTSTPIPSIVPTAIRTDTPTPSATTQGAPTATRVPATN